jgi:formylglycine-generating enzyme required for sulfatase activity
LYWELSYKEKLRFIGNRVLQIQTLIGDDQRGVSHEALDRIAKEVDWYVSRRDSLSQEPFKDGLRAIYGRASQYVPMVSGEFDKEKVPAAIGIYQAMVESEFRDCLMSDTGPVGIFQFTKATAEQHGLGAQDRCRVDLSSKAAAAYNSKLLRNFGSDRWSWTLAVLSFNQGEELTRSQLGELGQGGMNERNYWAISENRARLSAYDQDSDKYVHRFFAAAIIGENPEMFGLVTPPLSTIRTRTDLRVPNQNNLVVIAGGTFSMGRDDSANDFEKPEHTVYVEGFRMSKTEVTNIEFAEFIFATGYATDRPNTNFLAHWVNGRPMESDENTPVRFVNIDDVNAFIEWKSKNDGIQYRLPTEQEWEYAARNGNKNNLFPWGDKFDIRCAHINQANNDTVVVGTKTCPNQWGVQDLIGNVFEWTGSEPWVYPGSPLEPVAAKGQYMIRGGGAFDKTTGRNAITSTFRHPIPANRRSPGLGFRLVTSP